MDSSSADSATPDLTSVTPRNSEGARLPDSTTSRSWRPSAPTFARIALVAVISQAAIAVTGATVRLTGSGLGCSDWPTCEPGRFVAPWEFHAQVEFINRLITGIVSLSAGAALVAALMMRPRHRMFVRLSTVLVLGIFVQALVGAMVTKSELLPNWVVVHFLLSAILVCVATVQWDAARDLRRHNVGDPSNVTGSRPFAVSRRFHVGLAATAIIALLTGPLVTGSGPHAGDQQADRFGFDLREITRLHSLTVWAFVGLIVFGLWSCRVALSAPDTAGETARRIRNLGVVAVAQGAVGYAQYFTKLPAILVGIHVAGAMFVVCFTTLVLHRSAGGAAVPSSDSAAGRS